MKDYEEYQCPQCGRIETFKRNFTGIKQSYCQTCNATHNFYNKKQTKRMMEIKR